MTTTPQLIQSFLDDWSKGDGLRRTAAIRANVESGMGTWLEPGTGQPRTSPSTHLHEITLFGVNATGETAEAAVNNWYTIAERIAATEVAA